MKTPEKIKLGILLCTLRTAGDNCKGCPYRHEGSLCRERLATDLLGYTCEIESTVSQVKKALCVKENATLEEMVAVAERLQMENSAMLRDLKMLSAHQDNCRACKQYKTEECTACEEANFDCDRCTEKCACYRCKEEKDGMSEWEWRGVQSE